MAKKPTHNYDESKIKTLSSLEHIRKRTGMYIGRVGDGSHYEDGIYILLKEVIDNAIDEFIMGYGNEVEISVQASEVTVRDFGRGIPLGKLIDCVSRINTGAKYNSEVFQFSVGLNGVGTKAVNALAEYFHVRTFREGKFAEATFRQGLLIKEKKGSAPSEADGTLVTFTPDPEIFGNATFRLDLVERRIELYTYLNAGLRLRYNGKLYLSKGGLLDLVKEEVQGEELYPVLHSSDKTLEIAFTHVKSMGSKECYYSFVNGQYTSDGGTHLSTFREGLLKGINEFSGSKFDGDEVRESLLGAIAIRIQEPIFESQTKNKLGNTEIRSELVNRVRERVLDLMHRNPQTAELLLKRVEETRKLRRELQAVKKVARERARATSLRIPQLKDCRIHLNKAKEKGEESMIFITEGQSAAGSIVSCRDVNTQAIFTLKGKPLNTSECKRDTLYKNVELYNLMRSLDIEDTLEHLRYGKVILATDADVDGLHIRNLLLTYFLRFFEEMVFEGRIHILETPLFRVRNKKETRYCYSEKERDAAIKDIRGAEITRFKGLGEISPKEFAHFIGPDMRLTEVQVRHHNEVPRLLRFYMGRNTPERREYILDHLVVLDENV